ncbi:MAG: hypothetical protein JEZ07_16815 [Phycisphaerae bacterium]|nr:hypothetical protein [Phycisphaerae bacterium]
MSKKSKIKTVKKVVVALVLLIIVAIVGGIFFADHLIVQGVNTIGTAALNVETKLDSAHLSILGGSLSLKGMQVANPEGFDTDHLMQVGKISTSIDTKSIMGETIIIKTILIEELVLTIEQKNLLGKSNLQTVLDNITAKEKEAEEQPQKPEQTEDASGKKVMIELIEIIDAKAEFALVPIPGKTVLPVKLGKITLKNISQGQNKAVMATTIFHEVLLALAEGTLKSGADLPGELVKGLGSSVMNLHETLPDIGMGMFDASGKIIKGAGSLLKETGKDAEKVLKETGKGIGDALKLPGKLFPGKKEDKEE